MPDMSLLQGLSLELGITVSELLDGERSLAEGKSADEAINQIINYSMKTKREQIFSKKVIISITVFLAIIMVMYFGLIRLITSM